MNIQLNAVGGSAVFYMLDDNPQTHALRGSLKEQDVTPTFVQATSGQAGSTDTQPTEEVVWRDVSGSMGLYKQSQAPGDLTRTFISDADTTRPNQITAWLQWPGGSTVGIDADAAARFVGGVTALVNTTSGWGFVGPVAGSSNTSYWLWNGTKFALQRAVFNSIAQSWNGVRLAGGTTVYAMNSANSPAPTIIQQTGTNLWAPVASGGCSDISVAPLAGVGVTFAYHAFVYFDILFVLAITGGNITITPYRPNTPAVGNVLNSVTYTGLTPALATIPGESVCLGVVAAEGAVYIATDKAVYAMQWNDNNNTILTSKLFELPRITGAPVVWNGEVYIPSDNRIAHITPGQRGYDWRMVDGLGTMPLPYSGTIIQLLPMTDCLLAQVADFANNSASAVLRMDPNGAWSGVQTQTSFYSGSTTANPTSPMIPVVDGTNGTGFAMFNWAGVGVGTVSATVYALPAAGRNPRTLATSARKQRPGPFRTILPYFDLSSETAQKAAQRIRETVLNTTAGLPIKVYYQTDYADEQGTDTFTTGCAVGTGTWHQIANMVPSGVAGTNYYAGSTDATGTGTGWYEFDGATAYTTVGTLPIYPTNKQIRYLIEINGDSTGTVVPTHVSLAYQLIEYVTKAYQTDVNLRLRVLPLHGVAAGGGGSTVTYATGAALVAAKNALKSLVSAKTPCTYMDETGTTRVVAITKYVASIVAVQSDGTPGEYAVNLTLQDYTLKGQN